MSIRNPDEYFGKELKVNDTADGSKSAVERLVMAPTGIEIRRDLVAEKLDEMADICEHWKRNREKGREPNAIRYALMSLAEEVITLDKHKGP